MQGITVVHLNSNHASLLPAAQQDYVPLVSAEIIFSYGASANMNSTSCINFTVINDNILENTELLSVIAVTRFNYVFISPTMSSAYVFIFEDPYDCKFVFLLLHGSI